jgi:restriction endonuclease S subunit
VSNWKPKIDIDPEWESRTVSEIAKLEYGIGEVAKDSGEYRYIRITDIGENGELKNTDKKYIRETEESKKYLLKRGDVLVARTGATFGKTLYFNEDEKSAFAGFLIRLNFDNDRVLSKFYWCFAQSENYREQAKSLMTGGGQPQFNANAVGKIVLPLPSLEIQKQIVEKIEAERALVESTKKLIDIYQEKTKNVIAKLWEA